jgi:hypothetical protein
VRTQLLLAGLAGATLCATAFAVEDVLRPDRWEFTAEALSAEGAIGVTHDGRSYGVPTDVRWRDARGREYLDGRPDCLPPVGTTVPAARFTAVEVEVNGTTTRQVVFVECLQ